MKLLFTGFAFMLLTALPAMAVNKCEINGKVSYTDAPCPNGKTTTLELLKEPRPERQARPLRANGASQANHVQASHFARNERYPSDEAGSAGPSKLDALKRKLETLEDEKKRKEEAERRSQQAQQSAEEQARRSRNALNAQKCAIVRQEMAANQKDMNDKRNSYGEEQKKDYEMRLKEFNYYCN
ncbi:DUF4124 domain-containing protein [Massilia sp. W12]|uniref:DUF4124 domain-containing protein n=1 Tax=Massilia sp. W12 TaxID=3126507 RepID=UPI0030D003AA